MTALAIQPMLIDAETLPALIDRAAGALSSARTSAEVLEARDMARVAYDAAKSAGRMARAKAAHDEVIAAVYRAQADAAVIEARAKVRLADEYDAAQERGEVARSGERTDLVGDHNEVRPTAADLGLRRDEIHEARKLRDAEAAQPGKIDAAAKALVERGEEPTKAALRREVIGAGSEPDRSPTGAEPEPDPDAAARAALAGLTRAGLEDEVIGLRAENADLRAKLKAAKAEVADLKEKVKDLAAGSDLGPTVSRLHAHIATLKGARDDLMAKNAVQGRRISKLEAERDEALRKLGDQLIPL